MSLQREREIQDLASMTAGTDENWVAEEPRFSQAFRVVARRAFRRPVRLLVVTVIATAAVVGYRALRPNAYVATLNFRLVESDLVDPLKTPRPPRALVEYIYLVALSRDRVERIMREFQWSSAWMKRDRVAAIDQFREDIGVEARQNFFLFDRKERDAAPRSASVSIWLRGPDPAKTRALLHEIGNEILEEQAAYRSARLARAREHADSELARARERLKGMQQRLADLRLAAEGARGRRATALKVETAKVESELPLASEQMLALQQIATEARFSAAAENAQLGLTFELFDESLVAASPAMGWVQLVRLGLFAFAAVLSLAVPVLGAFDDRLYDAADVRAAGLPLLGALLRFPGDDAGATRSRRKGGRV